MKKFAIVGLGNFGSNLARSLAKKGAEVLAIDKDEKAVHGIMDSVTQAIVADALDKKALESLNIEDFDCVIVSLGEKVDASILVSLSLKKMGIKEIVAKAISDDHAEALQSVGATIVVFPERDMARKIADSLLTPNLIDFIPLTEGQSIVEMRPPSECIGKTLSDLEIRSRFGLQILAVRTTEPSWDAMTRKKPPQAIVIPDGSFRIEESHVLIIIGDNKNIEKFRMLP